MLALCGLSAPDMHASSSLSSPTAIWRGRTLAVRAGTPLERAAVLALDALRPGHAGLSVCSSRERSLGLAVQISVNLPQSS